MLHRLNGWQRIWFVATCLGALYGLGYALVDSSDRYYGSYHWKWRDEVIADLANPACRDYIVAIAKGGAPAAPWEKYQTQDAASEGPWAKYACYSLRTARGLYPAPTPYTIEGYDAAIAAKWTWDWLSESALMLGLALVVSGLVYFVGFLIAWIRRGFRQAPN